ncbi:MAG TPA: acyltransferase family protein [Stenotrophomonas sp.]
MFPLLFLAWRGGAKVRLWSVGLFALATGASLAVALAQAQVPGREIASFYLTTTRFWQLGLGVLLYQAMSLAGRKGRSVFATGLPLPPMLRALLLPVALGLIGFGLWSARPGHSPWPDGLWPVLGTLGVIALLHHHATGVVGRVLGSPGVVAIGRWSYSLYLWHWPVLVLLRWTVGLDSPWIKLFAVVATFALAIASYRWIELPWRHRPLRVGRSGRVVVVGLACLVVGAGVQSALANNAPRHVSLSTVSRHPLDWYAYARGLRKELPNCRQATENRQVEGALVRGFSRGQCDLPPGDGRTLFVVGDSHALAYNELLRRYAVLQGESVQLYAVGGCAIANLPQWQGPTAQCQAFLQAALADVSQRARPGDVLLLPGLRVPRLADQDQRFALADNLSQMRDTAAVQGRAAQVEATVAQLRPLDAQGVRIVFEAPKPILPAPPYRCSDWFNRGNAICSDGLSIDRVTMEAYRAPALQDLQRIVAALPGASLWDPLPVLCPGARCEAVQGGRPLFFDGDHLSGYGNRLLLPSLRAHLDRLPKP